MRKSIYKLVSVSAMSVALLVSCGDKSSETVKSPKFNMISSIEGKAAVVSIDFMKLIEMVDISNLDDLPPMAKMQASTVIGAMLNSEQLGVKLEGNNHVIISMGPMNQPSGVYAIMEVLDKEKVPGALANMIHGKAHEVNGVNAIKDDYDGMVACAWDDKWLVVGLKPDQRSGSIEEKDVINVLKSKDTPGADDAELSNYLLREDHINYFGFSQGIETANIPDEVQISEELIAAVSGIRNTGSINFNNGEIVMEATASSSKLKESKFNVFGDGPVDDSFLKFVGKDTILGIAAGNVSFEGIQAIMNAVNVDDGDFRDAKMGLDMVAQAFTGQGTISWLNVKEMDYISEADELMMELEAEFGEEFGDMEGFDGFEPSSMREPMPIFLAALGVKDEANVKAMLEEKGRLESVDGIYSRDMINIAFADDKMVVSNDLELVKEIKANNGLSSVSLEKEMTTPLYGYSSF